MYTFEVSFQLYYAYDSTAFKGTENMCENT